MIQLQPDALAVLHAKFRQRQMLRKRAGQPGDLHHATRQWADFAFNQALPWPDIDADEHNHERQNNQSERNADNETNDPENDPAGAHQKVSPRPI